MPSEIEQKERLRARLKVRLSRVPDKVNSGGLQAAKDFKEFYKKATAMLSNSRATLPQLESLSAQSMRHYQ